MISDCPGKFCPPTMNAMTRQIIDDLFHKFYDTLSNGVVR